MKPIRLSIKGLNSFVEEQVIDFEQLTSRGLFGIFGPTGSGKTSILDGITLSLYGDISRTTKEFINTNMDTAVVSFEFEIAGNSRRRYKVERAFKGSKSGGVTTKYARIIQIQDGNEIIEEDRPTKVNEACEAIIGLTKEDFTRTVVLPQGKFSDFLKLKNKDRGEMLERLFNLQAYGDELTAKLQRRAKQVRQNETELSGELKAYVDVTPESIEMHNQQLISQESALEQARQVSQEADKVAEQAQGVWQLQQELTQVTERRLRHLAASEDTTAKEQLIASAEAARQLMPQVQEWERLAKSHEELKQQLALLEEKRDKQRLEHDAVKQHYDQVTNEREQELPKFQAQQLQLETAVSEKAKLMEQRIQLEADEKQLENLTEGLAKLQAESNETNVKLQALTLEIQRVEAALEPLRQPESYRTALSNLYALLNQKQTAQGQIEKLNQKKNDLIEMIEGLKLQLTASLQTQQTARQGWESVNQQVETLKETLPTSAALMERATELERLKNVWAQHDKIEQQLEMSKKEDVLIESQLEPLKVEASQVSKQIEHLSEKLKQLGLDAQASLLRSQLIEGKPCMVCGATHHPLGHQIAMTLDSEEITAEALKAAEQKSRELERQIIELKSRREQVSQVLKRLEEELEVLGSDFKAQPVEAAMQNYQLLADFAKTGQSKLDGLLLEQQTAQEQLSSAQLSAAESETALKANESQLAHLTTELDQLEKAADQMLKTLQMEQQALKVTNIAEAYEAMQTKANTSERLETELRELRRQEGLLQLASKQEQERLKASEASHITLKTHCQLTAKGILEKTKQLESQFGNIETLETQLTTVQSALRQLGQRYETLKKQFDNSGEALKTAEETHQGVMHQCKLQGENREQAESVLRAQLSASIFDTPRAVKNSFMEKEALESLKTAVRLYHEETQRLNGALEQLTQQLAGRSISAEAYQNALTAKMEAQTTVSNLSDSCIALKTALNTLKQRYEQMGSLIEEKAKVDKELAQITDLEKLFQGKRFVAYMAAHKLKYISGKASEQLFDISLGNYGIETDEEGNFAIRDYKNGGVLRDPSSLSGGETFMVSLALALALSAQIQLKGTAPLEFFFLDEGFGTLDEDTLEVVLSALERLHHERLSIGLISHVESIKNRVPIKLVVAPARSGLGGSRVKIELS